MKKRTVFVAVHDPIARQEIIQIIQQDPAFVLFGWADNLATAVKEMSTAKPDLLFLEVPLNNENGFRLLDRFGNDIPTIFIDQDSRHILRSFSHHVVDYLIKPMKPSSLRSSLNKYKQRNSTLMQAILAENLPLHTLYPKKILVETGNRHKSLAVSEIVYIKADRDYTWIHEIGGEVYLSNLGISEMAKRLDPSEFIRIHRSYIINAEHISEFYRDISKTFVLLNNNTELPVGRSFLSNMKELVF